MSKKTKPTPEQVTTLFLEKIPMQTKADFKAACIKRRMTMREVFLAFMKDFIRIEPGSGR